MPLHPSIMNYFGFDPEGPGGRPVPLAPLGTATSDLDPALQKRMADLEQQYKATSDPSYGQNLGAASLATQEAMRQQGQLAAYAKAAAQMGSIGGRVADTSAIDMSAQNNIKSLAQQQGSIDEDRAKVGQIAGLHDKVAEYLQGRRDLQANKLQEAAQVKQKIDADKEAKAADHAWQEKQDATKFGRETQLKGIEARNALDVANAKAKNEAAAKVSEGDKASDRKFGETYNTWLDHDKQAADKSLSRLKQAQGMIQEAITKGETISGNTEGRLPDWSRSKKGREVESIVNESALAAIRSIVGGQGVSDADVRNVLRSWYDPTLDEKQNLEKLSSNIAALEQQKIAKENMVKYFAGHGRSLSGYEPGQTQEETTAPVDHDAALLWVKNNPNDPRAATILQRLGK